MLRPEIQDPKLWRWMACLFFALLCGGCDREREVSELHFELNPLMSNAGTMHNDSPSEPSKWVPEYFAGKELHGQLGEVLGRTSEDVGDSLTVSVHDDSDVKFTLKAEGDDQSDADALVMKAFSSFEAHMIAAHQRHNDEMQAELEEQIEKQRIKVAEAKARMEAAFEKMQESRSAEGIDGDSRLTGE